MSQNDKISLSDLAPKGGRGVSLYQKGVSWYQFPLLILHPILIHLHPPQLVPGRKVTEGKIAISCHI